MALQVCGCETWKDRFPSSENPTHYMYSEQSPQLWYIFFNLKNYILETVDNSALSECLHVHGWRVGHRRGPVLHNSWGSALQQGVPPGPDLQWKQDHLCVRGNASWVSVTNTVSQLCLFPCLIQTLASLQCVCRGCTFQRPTDNDHQLQQQNIFRGAANWFNNIPFRAFPGPASPAGPPLLRGALAKAANYPGQYRARTGVPGKVYTTHTWTHCCIHTYRCVHAGLLPTFVKYRKERKENVIIPPWEALL